MNNWNSLADFIYMNGHGYYVWCAYGAFVLGVLFELYGLITRRPSDLSAHHARSSSSAVDAGKLIPPAIETPRKKT